VAGSTQEALDRTLAHMKANDTAALGRMAVEGDALPLSEGSSVTCEERDAWSGKIKVRVPGEPRFWWVFDGWIH
jgi:hypothetical protein